MGVAIPAPLRCDRNVLSRHQVARVELRPQSADNGIPGRVVDTVTAENAHHRLVALHGHRAAVAIERDLRERDRTGEGHRGTARAVAVLCRAGRLDVPAGSRFDADRDRDATALAVYTEQEPHLTANRHAPKIRPFLDCLDDSVGFDGAHAGPFQQDGQAIAAPNAEGLQFGFDLCRRDRRLHRRSQGRANRRDQCECRNAAYPTAKSAIHTPNQSHYYARARRFVSQNQRTTTDPDGTEALCQSRCEQIQPELTCIPA